MSNKDWHAQHLAIPRFEALIAESLEAVGEPGMVPRLLRHLGQALGSHKVVLFCPLPGEGDPLEIGAKVPLLLSLSDYGYEREHDREPGDHREDPLVDAGLGRRDGRGDRLGTDRAHRRHGDERGQRDRDEQQPRQQAPVVMTARWPVTQVPHQAHQSQCHQEDRSHQIGRAHV